MRKLLSTLSEPGASEGLPVQAAAICYRLRDESIEFLLVNTSSGKWTFPKGRIDPGLTGSESAAREAWEEAGAMGRIEEEYFGWYQDTKRALGHDNRTREIVIAAYLFEVRKLVDPEETHRNPSWFTAREAKKRLAELRAGTYSAQMSRVIDSAVKRATGPRFIFGLLRAGRRQRFAAAR